MSSVAVAPRARKSFSRLKHVLDLPDLIDIQKASFRWFMEVGLRETIDDISPIEDYTGTLAVEFGEYEFGEPQFTIQECREKDLTYQVPLSITVRFVNKETGEIREQRVFMGDVPMMTPWGTFIINGTERVIVTQLVRSPGAYLMEPKDPTKQVFTANLMPSRGSWLEVEIDKKGVVYARIDRKRKLAVTSLLRALPTGERFEELFRPVVRDLPELKGLSEEAFAAKLRELAAAFEVDASSNEKILRLFGDSVYIRNTLEKDPTTREEEALIEVFKKQRPGEPPTLENARNLLRALFFDPKRYDLTRVGRYKLNQRLGLDVPEGIRVLTPADILALVQRLVELPAKLGVPEDSRDYAADAASLSRDPIRGELDEYEDFGNRRLRTTGELIQEAFRVGLYRMERVVRERMTTEDVDTITPQTIINIRPVVAALKEFFGSSQLSQFMDQTNSLSGLTHRRRLSALGAGGLTRERAPIEVRDVHPTHYGRMCPIETPEGPNIGLMGSLASYATVSEFGFIQTPYRVVKNGRVTDEIVYLDAAEERQYTIAQASEPVDPKTGRFLHEQILCRSREGEAVVVAPKDVDFMDVSPAQIVSVATALIPFLEHNDANRALMGANMQRQAVPLMIPQAPLIGTGLEFRAAVDTGDVVLARNDGTVVDVDAERIVVEGPGTRDEYVLTKFMRSNQGTLIHQKPVVHLGDRVVKGQVLADGSSTDGGELALGANLLVAFMPWEGFNFEDAIVISERLVKDDVLSSIHIHEYEIDARSTKLGDEEITRDIPNRSEESLANLDERGVVRIGAEVGSGDLLVGKVTPKGETELTAEEKLIRAIFKEKAREVRDTSLKVPHGEGGKVIGVKTFSRDAGDDLPPGVNELVRVYVAKKRKIAEGDKLAGRHGNKGVIAKIVPEEDMPFLEDGRSVDVVLNPLGVPSRMNIGQILETHLGWAAAHGVFADGGTINPRAPINAPDPRCVATPVFDGATPEDVDDALVEWARSANGDGVLMPVDESAPRGRRCTGKVTLYDGKTGEPFAQPVTVGFLYIMKLLHLVDDKIHARSTGPYSLVTQQPLGGKAQFGGQRFGEMEVWALEAYGSAYTLQEMLTIKSDDTIGRVKAYEAIVKGENIAEPSIPESFKVLLKEMQSLALDVHVISEEGREVEVREEDDELLRAAEELGIDLSPGSLRAAARPPTAEEVEEGAPAPEEEGELVLAADEQLGDLEGEEPDIEALEVEELADLELEE
ncbi:MAG TPA: DNA-directed RNA polymerase subunit beta [Gaiellaceae bacterium]|nr:DNA-directed RNA polymerase subunit beta [Gaiellaceae bacterium]